jgi:hypothetical protein
MLLNANDESIMSRIVKVILYTTIKNLLIRVYFKF